MVYYGELMRSRLYTYVEEKLDTPVLGIKAEDIYGIIHIAHAII